MGEDSDVPTNLRTEAIMEALCVKLGTFLQAELDENRGNYVRVQVAMPLNRPLETSVAMFATLKEKRTKVELEIQYEKLPNFFYTYGYLGDEEKSCVNKVEGGCTNRQVQWQAEMFTAAAIHAALWYSSSKD